MSRIGLRAALELVRAPATLSVPGDTMAGAALAGRGGTPALAAASVLLYWAGMALNDWADRDIDAVERPERPIPSGRISANQALGIAAGLTGAGIAVAAAAGGKKGFAIASLLGAAVWAYDMGLKHTPAGPASMAACRTLDVMLGAGRVTPMAFAVGAHTYGISILGRAEVSGADQATVRGALRLYGCRHGPARPSRSPGRGLGRRQGDRGRPRSPDTPPAAGRRRWRCAASPTPSRSARRCAPRSWASCRSRRRPWPGRQDPQRAGPGGRAPGGPLALVQDVDRMNFGYCSNGFRDHSLDDALTVLADLGYTGVALTLDHGHLGADPTFDEVSRVATRLGRLGLSVVVETGGRYTLDPFRKHFPTLLHDDAGARISYTRRAIEVAADLGAPVVHLWSGIRPPEVPDALAWDRRTAHCETLLAYAEEHDVVLGFEPEPGMLVDDLASYERLRKRLGESPTGSG